MRQLIGKPSRCDIQFHAGGDVNLRLADDDEYATGGFTWDDQGNSLRGFCRASLCGAWHGGGEYSHAFLED